MIPDILQGLASGLEKLFLIGCGIIVVLVFIIISLLTWIFTR